MALQLIIVDTAPLLIEFKRQILRIEYFRRDGELPHFYHYILDQLIDYIADLENAYGNVLEFVSGVRTDYSPELPSIELEILCAAVKWLALALLEEFQRLDLYTNSGALWYAFYGFLDNDIVLKETTEEDYIN